MTPIEHYPKLANILGLSDLYFKREDLHPYGSHKGRSIPVMIDHYYKNGDRSFVISSSGNAALAAALYVTELNKRSLTKEQALDSNHAEQSSEVSDLLFRRRSDAVRMTHSHALLASRNKKNAEPINLDIFVGKNIAPHKLEKLKKIEKEDGHIRVLIKERPIQALTQAIDDGYRSLRQSTDEVALIGYESLAEELREIKNAGAVFVGTSSGTTAQALAEFFLEKKLPIQVHIVQTSSCHPISDKFENYDGPDEKSIADAIVSRTSKREPKLMTLINETGGYAWTATNEEINTAKELVNRHAGLNISNNSALSLVGAMQAVYRDWQIEGSVICLICGE